jgi:hypothetical protein
VQSFGGRRDDGGRQNDGHRRPAPPAIPGGSMMAPLPRSSGAEAGVGRSHGGQRGESGAGERAGRGSGSGRGFGFGGAR